MLKYAIIILCLILYCIIYYIMFVHYYISLYCLKTSLFSPLFFSSKLLVLYSYIGTYKQVQESSFKGMKSVKVYTLKNLTTKRK